MTVQPVNGGSNDPSGNDPGDSLQNNNKTPGNSDYSAEEGASTERSGDSVNQGGEEQGFDPTRPPRASSAQTGDSSGLSIQVLILICATCSLVLSAGRLSARRRAPKK